MLRRGFGLRFCGGRPSRDELRFALFDAEAEDLLSDVEHAGDHAVDREVGPQGFFVEVVVGLALLFRPVADLPWFEQVAWFVGAIGFELAQRIDFIDELSLHLVENGFAEFECGIA